MKFIPYSFTPKIEAPRLGHLVLLTAELEPLSPDRMIQIINDAQALQNNKIFRIVNYYNKIGLYRKWK